MTEDEFKEWLLEHKEQIEYASSVIDAYSYKSMDKVEYYEDTIVKERIIDLLTELWRCSLG